METFSKAKINWHLEILPRQTKKAFDFLSAENWLKSSGWYLAGGTALSLFAGHRRSVDLDFFTKAKNFDNLELLGKFLKNKNWKTVINKKNTVYGELFGAKISFIAYPFFIPAKKTFFYGAVSVSNPLDVAVMKVIAISQRGRKRDFFDLFWCAKNLEGLESTVKRLKKQYPSVAHNYHHILKSLVYFDDAESDPDPEIYFKAGWKEVKDFFQKETLKIMKKIV